MPFLKADPRLNLETFSYFSFVGLDTSKDVASMEVGEKQALIQLHNAHCDRNGQITVDAGAYLRVPAQNVLHIVNYTLNDLTWAQRQRGGISLHSDKGHDSGLVFNHKAPVSSAVFNRLVFMFAFAQVPYVYDGSRWKEAASKDLRRISPAFGIPVQRRLAVAGSLDNPNTVFFSRVDDHSKFEQDEDENTTSVLRAGSVNIENLLGTADVITGLATFEQNRLVVFTNDRAFIYAIDPDITQWSLDERANVNVGCCSHNSIANAGTDVLFCSRYGVHSIRRSEENGIMVYSYSMSENIETLYRSLFDSVNNKEEISATWDQDEGHYHVFFPQEGGKCERLTMTLKTGSDGVPRWSTGDFLNARTATSLSGEIYFGTESGIFQLLRTSREAPSDTIFPTARLKFPFFWNGSMTYPKQSHSIVLQATGEGSVTVSASDENGNELYANTFDLKPQEGGTFLDDPLSDSYELRFELRYRAMQLDIEIETTNIARITGISINVKKEP